MTPEPLLRATRAPCGSLWGKVCKERRMLHKALKLPDQTSGSDRVREKGDRSGEPEGLQYLHLRDGLLARGREDATSAGSAGEDGSPRLRHKARVRKPEALESPTPR